MLKLTVLLPLLAACCAALPAGEEPPRSPTLAALQVPADQAVDLVPADTVVREDADVVDPAAAAAATAGRPVVVAAEGDADAEVLGGAESRYGRHRWGGYGYGRGYGGWGGYGRGYGGWGGYSGYGYGRGYGGWGGYGWGGYGGYRRGGWW